MPSLFGRDRVETDLKMREKQTNLKKLEQRRLERDCFWTWPLGHAYRKRTVETTIRDEPVRIYIKTCACCSHTKNYVVDQAGHLRLDFAQLVPARNFAPR